MSPLFTVSFTVSQKVDRSADGAYMAVVCITDISGMVIINESMSLLARLSTFEILHPDRFLTKISIPRFIEGMPYIVYPEIICLLFLVSVWSLRVSIW